jgi:Transposase
MRIKITETKNSKSFYIIKSVRVNGKSTSKIVEKLGTLEEVIAKANGIDPYVWAKEQAKTLTDNAKTKEPDVLLKFSPAKQLKTDKQLLFNGGYLFLQQIYHQLGLHQICKKIHERHKFEFDLNSILAQLVYSRILFPGSKLDAYHTIKKYIETPDVQLHHFYRALEVITKENDYIQSQLYKNSLSVIKRNSKVLYYDCTNFFFEIEQEDGIRKYGHSKENRPNPIVQMGLFMDGDGLPLAFDITSGNTNEQGTLKPLEKKILKDFELSKFVVCTDAGLSSVANRKFNAISNRAFLTTQSIKKLKKFLKDWTLEKEGWQTNDRKYPGEYSLGEIHDINNKNLIFYKERWIKENDIEQRLIVSYSLKYKDYQETIRSQQIERAKKVIASSTKLKKSVNPNDFKRFIQQDSVTVDGEIAPIEVLSLDENSIQKESQFDGFYAVCTNLEDSVEAIIKVNHARWEIEETFRIMKNEFKARPVHLSRDERIKAHFITCFISMTIFRILEKRLKERFTPQEIIKTLRDMSFIEILGDGIIPAYTRTELTDKLHEQAGFRTDFQIITQKNLKNILKQTKIRKSTHF